MFGLLFGFVCNTFKWVAEIVVSTTFEALIFGQKEVITITKKKKKKKKPAMTKKNTSPSKKQRKKMSQGSGGGYSSPEYLQPGARGHSVNSGPK